MRTRAKAVVGLLAVVMLVALVVTKPAKREAARYTALSVYEYAKKGDYEFGYNSDLWSAKHRLMDLERDEGRVLNFELVGESSLSFFGYVDFVMLVKRERGSFRETISIVSGRSKAYSRDYTSVRSIQSVPAAP
jgi:hypothetical protein